MRSRAAAVVGAVLVLALAGCGGSPKATSRPTPSVTSPVTPTSTPTSTPTIKPTVLRTTVTIGSLMTVGLPAGWVARRSPIVDGSGDVCLAPRGDTKVVFDCAGIEIWFGKRLPGAELAAYAPDRDNGWYPATDVEQCPFVHGKSVGIKTTVGFSSGLKPVGAHKANWNRWTASCDGKTFHPQAWYLPKSKVVIFDYLEHPETAAVLAAAKFASDGAKLSTYVSGHVVSASASKIVVQPFHTYTTGAVGKAYAKAHGLEYPFPNDYYDADEGPKRTILLNASTSCEGNVELGKPVAGAPVACSAFVTAPKGMPVGVWVLPGGSTAESVIEIYRP